MCRKAKEKKREKRKRKMKIIDNPFNNTDQSGRIDDIKAAYAGDEINKDLYDSLIADEELASKLLLIKRAAAGFILSCIAISFLLN